MDAVRAADERPVVVLAGLFVLTYVGLFVWALLDHEPVLLAAARPADRATVYGQLSSTAVAMLAVALTVLSILTALPDRPGVKDLRSRDAWPLLQGGLLATAALCMVCLVATHLGTAIDNVTDGKEWLSNFVVASATAAVVAVVTFGAAFWLALRRSQEPQDPAEVRTQAG